MSKVDILEPKQTTSEKSTSQSEVSQEQVNKRSQNDFIFGKLLGEGSFSSVYLAKEIHTKRELAIKVCNKQHILRENKAAYVKREKEALNLLSNSSYFVKLYCTFQDQSSLYFCITYAKRGDLLHLINKLGAFDLDLTRHYTCQLVIALETLNRKGIIHRDIKPENILLDEEWNILITDFGSSKIVTKSDVNTKATDEKRLKNSFVGTAHYVSPEVLNNLNVSFSTDLWALGCLIYQMLTGKLCFTGGSEYLIFQKILKLDYQIPEDFPKYADDLVRKLLVLKADERLGATDDRPYKSIRDHEFFKPLKFSWDRCTPYPPPVSVNEQIKEINFDGYPPGMTRAHMARLLIDVDGCEGFYVDENAALDEAEIEEPRYSSRFRKHNKSIIANISEQEIKNRLEMQSKYNKFHELVEGNLILKQGLLDKRKGLIPRRRMFLITTGPHIYYVEPNTMVLKGEIPWTCDLKVEVKNFKVFYVHTPNRTYYLEDPESYALQWSKVIEDVHKFYFKTADKND